MIRALRNRQPGRPVWRVIAWYGLHHVCFWPFVLLYHYRAWGIHNVPGEGPVLVVSNHQSFYDPILAGLGAHHRQFFALARSGLFRNRFFAALIRLLNAIPVEQGATDTRAMRACLDVLKDGQTLLLYPEGARTPSGRTEPFQPGLMLLIKRARVPVVPMAVEGAYHVWPRDRKLPRPTGRIGAMYGQPIEADELLAMENAEALEHLRNRIETMRLEIRKRIGVGVGPDY